ncbi:hypothetical protein ABI_07960 [Asticcacaulis biprosthecium C19]|uniref:Uncharacterized protein n=2 Tax=Asticcacaulis biprosthecium TaxID=76891 RepID=F4QLU1_9CAUL|nr:hypothetical protein ABI_07960 [Asticcacaulis biprosthecium C19]
MVLGEHARISDLVEIFSEGADIIPAYVEPQKAFFEEWLATPKPPYTG